MSTPFFIPKDPHEKASAFLDTLKGYLDPKLPLVSNLANMSALIKAFFPELNWAGFYLYDDEKLCLGPFQGLPACTSIALGKGVCGKAAKNRETILVADTHQFTGHIACDSLSRSELVVPIVAHDRLIGVLDLDSPEIGHFTEEDRILYHAAVTLLIDIC